MIWIFYLLTIITNLINIFVFIITGMIYIDKSISSVQSLSHVQLFATPWTATHQASMSTINSQSLLKLMSIELVMPSNHLILYPFSSHLQSFSASVSIPMSQFFASGDQNIGVSASASALPMNIQGWFPLGLTGLISLQVQGTLKSLLQHHNLKASNLLYGPTLTSLHD